MSTSIPKFEEIKRAIRQRHLEQLRDLDIVADPYENSPTRASAYDDLVKWTEASKAQMAYGKEHRVYGGRIGSPIDFKIAFVAFMESAAMYLRDTSYVVEAVRQARSGQNNEAALNFLEKSTAQIDALADMWGMHFIQICDFVTLHPDGHWFMAGPFCGAFIFKDIAGPCPFIGVAFKGTNPASGREIITDFSAISTIKASGRLWGSQVASGFYYSLFTTYRQAASKVPFVMIQQAVKDITSIATMPAVIHVTGHSLGGALASLCFGELCIEGPATLLAYLGDLYTFGAPRVGRGDFATAFRAAIHSPRCIGSSWRIVNSQDYIPKIPASPHWPISRDPFIHVDDAYKIYPDKIPEALASEIGTNPSWVIPTAISPHFTTEYYKSMAYVTGVQLPNASIKTLSILPLDISAQVDISSKLTDSNKSSAGSFKFELETRGDYIVGTFINEDDGCTAAEFTALGNIGKLSASSNIKFNVDITKSFKCLYSKVNQCVFTKYDSKNMKMEFVVDKVSAAYVVLPFNFDAYALPTRGSCFWTFVEGLEIGEISDQMTKAAASILAP